MCCYGRMVMRILYWAVLAEYYYDPLVRTEFWIGLTEIRYICMRDMSQLLGKVS